MMRLRELRINGCYTQKELGEAMNVSGQTILNWENGIFEPSLTQLVQLADFFGVSVDYLLQHETKSSKVEEICLELSKITFDEFADFVKKCLESK